MMKMLAFLLASLAAMASHASAKNVVLKISEAQRTPSAEQRKPDVEAGGVTLARSAGTLSWTLPADFPSGHYRLQFAGGASDNVVEWVSECEFEPYRTQVRREGVKDFVTEAFSFVVAGSPVSEVVAYQHPQLELPYRLATRRSDRVIELNAGDTLRLESRWRFTLAGDVELIPESASGAVNLNPTVHAPFGLFDTRSPIRFSVEVRNHSAEAVAGSLMIDWTDALKGALPDKQRTTLELAAGKAKSVELSPSLPFGAYTLHLRWADREGNVITHVQRHFTYSPYIDAAKLPDDWPLGFHHRGEGLLPPVGFKTMRVFTGWEQMQPKDGPYDWSQMDRIVEYCRANGHKILWVCNGLPRWASSRPEAQNSPQGDLQPFWAYAPKDWQLFEDLVRAFWARYAPDGKLDVVTSIEVLNEPNVRHARGLGFDGYYKTSEIVSRVTREMAPGAKVIGISESGGLHTWWVDGVLKTGAGKYYDAVSSHGYEINTPIGPVSHVGRFSRIRTLLDQYDLPNVGMWDTETGVGSWGRWGGQVVDEQLMDQRARASSQFDPRAPGKVGRSWRSSNEFVSSAWMVRSATQKLTLGVEQIMWFKWRAHEISWVHDYDAGGNPVPKLMNPVHAVLTEVLTRYGYKPANQQPAMTSPDPRFVLLAHRFEGPQGAVTVIYAHPKTGGFVVEDETAAKATAHATARVGEPVIPAEEGKLLATLPAFSSQLFEITVPNVRPNAVTMDILAREQVPVTLRKDAAVIGVSQEPVYLIEPTGDAKAHWPGR